MPSTAMTADSLRLVGLLLSIVGVLTALFVLWATRRAADLGAKARSYRMLSTILFGLLLPARYLLEDRIGIIAYVLVLAALLGGGALFLSKARHQE